jgi:hypothetical protein
MYSVMAIFKSSIVWGMFEHTEILYCNHIEVNYVYSLPNIVRMVKSRRMRWAGHVVRMGRREVCKGCWWGNLSERVNWGDPDVDGRIILRWIFRKLEWVLGTG